MGRNSHLPLRGQAVGSLGAEFEVSAGSQALPGDCEAWDGLSSPRHWSCHRWAVVTRACG